MSPGTVDAVNGYTLLAVSIMGIVPPVFTLMLLHSHGLKSWWLTTLTACTWGLNSASFFILVNNMSSVKGDSELLGVGRQNLFHTTSCGGSSAMALCHQLTGAEPLAYLDLFFNKGPIPNIKNIPMIWAFATSMLLFLVVRQAAQSWSGKERRCAERAMSMPALPALAESKNPIKSLFGFFERAAVRFGLLLAGTAIFCFALGYEFRVVREYQKMGIIDKKGWSFVQVVAVLSWILPLLDTAYVLIKSSHRNKSVGEEGEKPEQQGRSEDRQDVNYAPLRPVINRAVDTSYSPNTIDSWSDGESLLSGPHLRSPADGIAPRAITRRPVPNYRQGDHGHN